MKNKLPTLYKRTSTGAVEEWTIIVEDNTFYTESGQHGGKITRSAPTICEGKNAGKANETSGEHQALREAEAKIRKQKDKGYTEDIKQVDAAKDAYYKPMLAHKYDDHKNSVTFPCFAQTKFDGIRCIVTKDGAFTRNGKEIVTVPHILNALKHVFVEQPNSILDGELYNHELHDNFNKIASLVKKTKPSIEDLFESEEKVKYYVYDAPRIGNWDESANFSTRNRTLWNTLKDVPYIHLVQTVILNSAGDIVPMHDKFIEDGYEGLIVRLDKPYQNKRSKYLLKYKQFDTDEFIILDIQSGRGNKATMAAFICFKAMNGSPFTAGINGDEEYCKDLLNKRELYLGKTATVKYFRLTPDGLPRFPKVIEIDRQDI